jgi:hypothetical protein
MWFRTGNGLYQWFDAAGGLQPPNSYSLHLISRIINKQDRDEQKFVTYNENRRSKMMQNNKTLSLKLTKER